MIIKIKNLRLKTILGIYDFEQDFQREIIINAIIKTNHDQARFTNSIDDTIDYSIIINKIKNLVSSKNFQLIEKLAQEILDLIMEDDKIEECEIEVDKLKIFDEVDSASIVLTAKKN